MSSRELTSCVNGHWADAVWQALNPPATYSNVLATLELVDLGTEVPDEDGELFLCVIGLPLWPGSSGRAWLRYSPAGGIACRMAGCRAQPLTGILSLALDAEVFWACLGLEDFCSPRAYLRSLAKMSRAVVNSPTVMGCWVGGLICVSDPYRDKDRSQ